MTRYLILNDENEFGFDVVDVEFREIEFEDKELSSEVSEYRHALQYIIRNY